MEIKHIQTLALSLAARVGQAAAATMITEEYHKLGGGNLPLIPGKTWNNQQNIFHRWIEGRTPLHRLKFSELAPAIRAAHEAELAQRSDTQARVAITNKECIEATSAVLTGQPRETIRKEAFEAIDALAHLAGVTVRIAPERRAAA